MGCKLAVLVAVAVLTLAASQAASAATTIGAPSLSGTPQAGQPCPAAATTCTTIFTGARATAAGVITTWRIRALTGAQEVTLQTVVEKNGTWTVTGSDVARTISGGSIESFTAQLPIATGEALAISSSRVPAARDLGVGGSLTIVAGNASPTTLPGGLLLQADIDDTPALSIATAAAPQWGVAGEPVTHVYRAANAGPGTARDLVVTLTAPTFRGASSSRGSCNENTCRIDQLAAGESADISVALGSGAVGETLTSSATVAGRSAQAATTLTPPSVAPPPTPPAMPACVNVKIGTNDDELLDGSSFGDRLVGRGGRDLIHGYGADDCLEGGRGSDVLGGGFGSDRLLGGYGNDRLYGDAGNDSLRGGNGRDALSGGVGNDELLPGPGADRVYGGPGNDRVSSRDRTRDTIDCGPGSDSARVDRGDRVRGCERVDRG